MVCIGERLWLSVLLEFLNLGMSVLCSTEWAKLRRYYIGTTWKRCRLQWNACNTEQKGLKWNSFHVTADANDNTPTFAPSEYSFFVSYYAGAATVVGSVTATDLDTGSWGALTYTLDQVRRLLLVNLQDTRLRVCSLIFLFFFHADRLDFNVFRHSLSRVPRHPNHFLKQITHVFLGVDIV